MSILSSFMMIFSLLFFLVNHPLILTVVLTAQTINLSFMLFLKKNHSWFSYMLFMVFLSGMMIIFVYISSLASNQPVKISNKVVLPLIITMTSLTLLTLASTSTTTPSSMMLYNPFLESTTQMYQKNMVNLTTIFIIYLLIVLIVIVSISKKIKSPSRTY